MQSKSRSILTCFCAIILAFTLLSTVILAHHSHHEQGDEEHCSVCQFIETTLSHLQHTTVAPGALYTSLLGLLPLVLVSGIFVRTCVTTTLVQQKMRCNN